MSFFKASTKKEDLQQGGNSAYINKSGVFPVNVIVPFVQVSDKGSQVVELFVEHEGQKQPIYGNMRITNNNGDANKIGQKIFNQLVIIAGVEDVAEPETAELPIGKDSAMKDVDVLESLADIDVLMQVKMEYGTYNGNITEKKIIRGFYRPDMASAEEIVNESEVGVQYAKDEKYFEGDTYKDGLDEEAVAAWIAAGRPKGTAGKSAGGEAKKAPSFGKKKGFGSK